jgi:hypothetical protein
VSDNVSLVRKIQPGDLAKLSNPILIRSQSSEDRSQFTHVVSNSSGFRVLEKLTINDNYADCILFRMSEDEYEFGLRSAKSLSDFSRLIKGASVVIDITGFEHSEWFWLVRAALLTNDADVYCVYCEPESYTFSERPLEGDFFELSSGTDGVSALPGLATFANRDADSSVFIPMLGFEGPRLNYILDHVQPRMSLTYPVIGVPGFQIEFPFYAIHGNRRFLLNESASWGNRRFARANCPSSALAVLNSIRGEHGGKLFQVAPIGTKPHALGALLFKLLYPDEVDIVYDHPIRKANRTKGASQLLLFNLSMFRGDISGAR